MKKEYQCGCITEDYEDGVRFVKMCSARAFEHVKSYHVIEHVDKPYLALKELSMACSKLEYLERERLLCHFFQKK
jgi:hypothetical protein